MKFEVDKKVLIIIAGSMWCAVGIMLITYAIIWLTLFNALISVIFGFAGIMAGLLIHNFGFSKLAGKNIHRLINLNERRSIFSFITLKSYLIIPVMIAIGILFRHSPIPKNYLSVLYNGIGIGLFLSGCSYFCALFKIEK